MIYVNTHSSSLPICTRIQHVFKIFKVSAPWPLTQKILMWREGPDEAEASASAFFGSSARCSSAARFENHWEIKPSWRAPGFAQASTVTFCYPSLRPQGLPGPAAAQATSPAAWFRSRRAGGGSGRPLLETNSSAS